MQLKNKLILPQLNLKDLSQPQKRSFKQLFPNSQTDRSHQKVVNNLGILNEYVVKPKLVSDRSEWNSNIYLLQKRKKRKKYKPINTYLKIPFPLHHIRNYVEQHKKGFRNKVNIDLFKHYYRMYLQNKWLMNKLKKQKLIQKLYKRNPGQRRNETIISQNESNKIALILGHLSNKKASPPQSPQNSDDKISLPIKQFVIEKNYSDIQLHKSIIDEYEQKYDRISQFSMKNKEEQQEDWNESITNQVFSKATYVNMDSNLPLKDDQLQYLFNLEEIFINRLIELVYRKGLDTLNYFDYLTFQSIVNFRESNLRKLDHLTQLQRLLYIKQNLSKLSEQERKIKDYENLVGSNYYKTFFASKGNQTENQNFYTQSIPKPKVSPPPTLPFFKFNFDVHGVLKKLTKQQKQQSPAIFTPLSTLTSLHRKEQSQSTMIPSDELASAVILLGLQEKFFNLIAQHFKNPYSNAQDLQNFVDDIVVGYNKKVEQEQVLNTIVNEEEAMEDQKSIKELMGQMEQVIDTNQTVVQTSTIQNKEEITVNEIKKQSESQHAVQQKLQSTHQAKLNQSMPLRKRPLESEISVSKQESSSVLKDSTIKQPTQNIHSQREPSQHSFSLNAQKLNIGKKNENREEADEQLTFLQQVLEGHKEANKQIFKQIQKGEVDSEEEENDDDEEVIQYFRAERLLQHKYKKNSGNDFKDESENEEDKQKRRQVVKGQDYKKNKKDIQKDEIQLSSEESIQKQKVQSINDLDDTTERKQGRSEKLILSPLKRTVKPKVTSLQSTQEFYNKESPQVVKKVIQKKKSKSSFSSSSSSYNEIKEQTYDEEDSIIKEKQEKKQRVVRKKLIDKDEVAKFQNEVKFHKYEKKEKRESIYKQEINPRKSLSPVKRRNQEKIKRREDSSIEEQSSINTSQDVEKQEKRQKIIERMSKIKYNNSSVTIEDNESMENSEYSLISISETDKSQSSQTSPKQKVYKTVKVKKKLPNGEEIEENVEVSVEMPKKKKKRKVIKRLKKRERIDSKASIESQQNDILKQGKNTQKKAIRQGNQKKSLMFQQNESNKNIDGEGKKNSKFNREASKKQIKELSEEQKAQIAKKKEEERKREIQKEQMMQMKQEFQKLMMAKFNIKEMKDDIDQLISLIEKKGYIDEEVKYNIFVFEQRQKQLSQIQAQLNEVKDSIFLGNDCDEILSQIFKSKFRLKDLDDNLKFMKDISYKALLNQEEDESQLQLDLNFFVGSKWLKQNADERRRIFLEEKDLLKKGLNDDDMQIHQGSIEVTTVRDSDSIINHQKSASLLFNSEFMKQHKNDQNTKNSFDFKRFIRSKLKRIQQINPEKYEEIQNRSIEIQNETDEQFGYIKLHKPHLLEFKHKSPFNLTTIRMANKLQFPNRVNDNF